MDARSAALLGVAAAVIVGAVAVARRQVMTTAPASESTRAVRVTIRNAAGLPATQTAVRDRAHVQAIVRALGVDAHPAAPCPPDYAEAPVGLVLSGADVYAKRNVYVFGQDGGAPTTVVTVTSAGCRAGAPADETSLARELEDAALHADGGAPGAIPR